MRRVPDGDAALALIAFVALLADAAIVGRGSSFSVGSVSLAVLTAATLLARRRHPIAVLAAASAALLACLAVFHPNHAAVAIVMLLVYTVGFEGRRVRSLIVAAAMAPLVVLAVIITSNNGIEPAATVAYLALVIGALVAGDALRARRELARVVADEREAAMRQRLNEQRMELATELHDTLAHSLVGINIRAAAAARSRTTDDAQSALEEITATSAGALTELRTTLKILRDAEDEAPLRPAQSLAHLDDLLDNARRAGLQVHASVSSLPELPAATSHAAYRILQEALTNVLRHSNASSASVSVHADGKTLTLEVADDGVGDDMAIVAGHGLQGIAERAAALGGLCEAGPLPEGGWRLRASLPMRIGAA